MRVIAASLWAVLLVVGWACPLMADCFEGPDHATESSCHQPTDDSQGTLPEDCPYQIQKTSPAEGKFEPKADAAIDSFVAVVAPAAAWVPAEQMTPLVPPVVDDDYFHKLTVLLV